MPRLVEGSGRERRAARASSPRRWGMPPRVCVAGGAGDNAAGAVGIGVDRARATAFLSLGTSGVLFVAGDALPPDAGARRCTPSATRCPAPGTRWR